VNKKAHGHLYVTCGDIGVCTAEIVQARSVGHRRSVEAHAGQAVYVVGPCFEDDKHVRSRLLEAPLASVEKLEANPVPFGGSCASSSTITDQGRDSG